MKRYDCSNFVYPTQTLLQVEPEVFVLIEIDLSQFNF